MRKWLEWGLAVVVVVVAVTCVLTSLLSRTTTQRLETARSTLRQATTKVHAQPDSGEPRVEPVAARDPGQDNILTLKQLVERLGTLPTEVRDPYDLCFRHPQKRTDAEWAKAEALVKRFESLLADLRAFAQDARKGSVPKVTPESAGDLIAMWGLPWLANLCVLSGQVSAHAGDTEAAVRDVSAVFRLAVAAPQLHYPRSYILCSGRRGVTSSFSSGTLTKEQGDALVALAQGALPDRRGFAEGLAGLAELDSTWLEAPEAWSAHHAVQNTWADELGYRAMSLPPLRPFRQNQAAWTVATTQAVVELADRPYYEVRERLDAIRKQSCGWLSMDPLSTRPPEAYWAFLEQVFEEASLDLLRLGLAVEGYQKEHGSCPESLDAIAVSAGGHLPLDPFTGRPYRYLVSGDSFTLYSLGEDQADQGGKPGVDLVWRGDAFL